MQNDLISRSAAKDEILSWAVCIFRPNLLSKDDTMFVLDKLPAVDAVEVVRCKDCIAFIGETKSVFQHCAYSGMNVGKDDFCSCGERRDDDAAD